ncbi:thioredoxin-disulfide reductase [bacterium DOLZORAL124_38_8]|nr:MAG: thioredoxin-disulfide reductase [bacterium DOLZORAL124_38_8]
MKEKLVIIGSGPAGLTAAIYAARADLNPLVLEGSNPGGQLMGTSDVENFPGFPDGIMGPELMANMRTQAQNFGARTANKMVKSVDFSDEKNLKLHISDTETIETESVIIATGASARWLDFGGDKDKQDELEKKFWGRGYTACATCDGAFFRNKTVCVVGGGDTACEEAMFLTKFASKVYLIHRRNELRASKPMQERVFANEKIEMVWNKNVTDINGDMLIESVELTDSDSGEKSTLELNGIFVAIGHNPNTKFLDESIELTDAKYIKVTNKTRTNIPSVFVAGDVSDHHYQQAITAAGAGCMAAMDAEQYLN